MKKIYKKPYLGVESFQLNAAVAAACSSDGRRPINHRSTTCSFPEKSGQFFSLVNCQIDVSDGSVDGNDTICYHGPLLSNGITLTFS